MNAMTRFTLAAAQILLASAVYAETPPPPPITIELKDGQIVSVTEIKRDGSNVMVPLILSGEAKGERGYSLASITRINFPEPPEINIARELMLKGNDADVISKLNPVMENLLPFRDVQGNWWQEVAQLKMMALVSLGKDTEASELIQELKKSPDQEVRFLAMVYEASSAVRKGEYQKSLPIFTVAIATAKDRVTLANAWLNKGQCYLALSQWEDAIIAYLRVPIFFADQKLLLPTAHLGSARAMAGLGDSSSAISKYNELIQLFPNSAEATIAKTELDKLPTPQ